MTSSTTATTHVLFIGLTDHRRVFHDNGLPEAAFIRLTADEVRAQRVERCVEPAEYLYYPASLTTDLRWCNPGAAYAVTIEEGEEGKSTIQYKKRLQPAFIAQSPYLSQWSATHRATSLNWAARKRAEKAAKVVPYHEALAPIRAAYNNLHGSARAHLIADVVAYITRRGR